MLAVYTSLGTHLSCSTVPKPWRMGQIFVQGIESTSYSQSRLSSYSYTSLVCADTEYFNMMINTVSSVHLHDSSLTSALIEFYAEVGLSTECIHSFDIQNLPHSCVSTFIVVTLVLSFVHDWHSLTFIIE